MAVSGRNFGQAPCIRILVYSNRSPPNYLVPLARLFKEVNHAQSHRERPTSTCVFAILATTSLTTVSSNPVRILFRYEHVFLRIDIAPHAARHVSRGLHCETSPTYTLNGMKSREIHSTFQGNISNVDPTKNVANQQEDNDDKKKRTRNEKQKQMNRSWQIKHSLGAVWEDILPLQSISLFRVCKFASNVSQSQSLEFQEHPNTGRVRLSEFYAMALHGGISYDLRGFRA